jgi:hypothetical protein
MNFSGKNCAMAMAVISSQAPQDPMSTANSTRITMFQQPGKPENELSPIFIRVSAK